jgi:hypothetical protein
MPPRPLSNSVEVIVTRCMGEDPGGDVGELV